MNFDEKLKLAKKLYQQNNFNQSNSEIQSHEVKEINATYFFVKDRCSPALLIGNDGEYLFAPSFIRYEHHCEAFLNGQRSE